MQCARQSLRIGRDVIETSTVWQATPIMVVALWHETLATEEVINYVSIRGSTEQIEKVRHDLYSRYGLKL